MKLINLVAVSALLGVISFEEAVNAMQQKQNLESYQNQQIFGSDDSEDEISDSDDS